LRLKTLIPKSEARKLAIQRKSEISPEELKKQTNIIIERFSVMDDFVHAKTVHCYLSSRPGEFDTRRLIDLMDSCGKTIVIPKMNQVSRTLQRFYFTGWENIVKNSEGFLEPRSGVNEDNNDIDLFIVPALAVSTVGHRVGYGGGFYDKMLKNTYAPKAVLVSEFQVFDSIEYTPQDVRMDRIITERRIINTRDSFGDK
jgi:5-formyltetrahydrofolate cyclo-ligase